MWVYAARLLISLLVESKAASFGQAEPAALLIRRDMRITR